MYRFSELSVIDLIPQFHTRVIAYPITISFAVLFCSHLLMCYTFANRVTRLFALWLHARSDLVGGSIQLPHVLPVRAYRQRRVSHPSPHLRRAVLEPTHPHVRTSTAGNQRLRNRGCERIHRAIDAHRWAKCITSTRPVVCRISDFSPENAI